MFNRMLQTSEQWTVWVFPLYRLTKKVFTICEKDDKMTSAEMIKRIQAFTKDYGVEWEHITSRQYNQNTKKFVDRVRLSVRKKPDPQKDVQCTDMF